MDKKTIEIFFGLTKHSSEVYELRDASDNSYFLVLYNELSKDKWTYRRVVIYDKDMNETVNIHELLPLEEFEFPKHFVNSELRNEINFSFLNFSYNKKPTKVIISEREIYGNNYSKSLIFVDLEKKYIIKGRDFDKYNFIASLDRQQTIIDILEKLKIPYEELGIKLETKGKFTIFDITGIKDKIPIEKNSLVFLSHAINGEYYIYSREIFSETTTIYSLKDHSKILSINDPHYLRELKEEAILIMDKKNNLNSIVTGNRIGYFYPSQKIEFEKDGKIKKVPYNILEQMEDNHSNAYSIMYEDLPSRYINQHDLLKLFYNGNSYIRSNYTLANRFLLITKYNSSNVFQKSSSNVCLKIYDAIKDRIAYEDKYEHTLEDYLHAIVTKDSIMVIEEYRDKTSILAIYKINNDKIKKVFSMSPRSQRNIEYQKTGFVKIFEKTKGNFLVEEFTRYYKTNSLILLNHREGKLYERVKLKIEELKEKIFDSPEKLNLDYSITDNSKYIWFAFWSEEKEKMFIKVYDIEKDKTYNLNILQEQGQYIAQLTKAIHLELQSDVTANMNNLTDIEISRIVEEIMQKIEKHPEKTKEAKILDER